MFKHRLNAPEAAAGEHNRGRTLRLGRRLVCNGIGNFYSGTGGVAGHRATQAKHRETTDDETKHRHLQSGNLQSRRLHKTQGSRVHAVAQPRRLWAIIKNVAQMRVTEPAGNGGARHAKRTVLNCLNIFFGDWLPETWPARA